MSDPALDIATENFGDALVQELNQAKSGQHLSGSLNINAATATKLETARTIALTGDVTASGSFDGSANLNLTAVLANTGVIPNSYNSATQLHAFTINSKGQVVSVGAAITIAPNWSSIQNKPTTVDGLGLTDAAKRGANADITSLSGLTTALSASQGGTGISSYSIGDLLTATGSTTLGRLAAVSAGNVLLSSGVGVTPSWGKVDLAQHISGVLPISNGGTGAISASAARTNLGLQIGVDVQPWNARLDSLSSLGGISGFVKKASANGFILDTTDYMPIEGGVFSGGVAAANSTGPIAQTSGLVSKFSINSLGAANAAFMCFNRSGEHAVYFGLDIDNKLKVGGYSLGANAYEILHAGNFNPGDYLPRSDGTLVGDTTLNNAVYLKAKTSTGAVTRVLGINALNHFYIGSIDSAEVQNVFISTGGVVRAQFTNNLATFSTPITGPRAEFNCFRAQQGAPNSTDLSTNGYAFGSDGDTGLFAIGSSGSSNHVSVYHNNLEMVRHQNDNGVYRAIFAPGASRQITIRGGSGQIDLTADTGGWSNAVNFYANGSSTVAAAYGAQGTGSTFINLWMGPTWTAPWMTLDAQNGIQSYIQERSNSTSGAIATQTSTTTAGIVVQGKNNGDGAFITFMNRSGTSGFSLGMDSDGEFKVGGGSIGAAGYRVYHDAYNPGAMRSRGLIPFASADATRPTGTYVLQNASNTASYSLIEFADIGGSTARVQFCALYGGSGAELYYRTTRDTQTQWDGVPILSNRIWHSGNVDPLSKSGGVMTGDLTISKNTPTLKLNTNTASTHAYITYTQNDSNRWTCGKNSATETGSNTGSDYSIRRFADNGSLIETALEINRASGQVTIQRDLILGSTSQFIYANNIGVISSSSPLSFVNNSDFVWKRSVGGGGATLMTLSASGNLSTAGSISTTNGFIASNATPTPGNAWLSTPPYSNQGDGRTHFGYNVGSNNFVNYIRGNNTVFEGLVTASGGVVFGPVNSSDNTITWTMGPPAWGGSVTGANSVGGIVVQSSQANTSQLFTFSSANGQLSLQLDGSVFIGENYSGSFNPFTLNASSPGGLLVQNNASVGGDLRVQGTTIARSFRASKGTPVGSGDAATVGYAFGGDGDTGVFSVGAVGDVSSTGVSIFSDGLEVSRSLNDRFSIFVPALSGPIMERFTTIANPGGTVTYDYRNQSIWRHTAPTGNFTVALTNVLALANHVITATLIVEQGSTGFYPSNLTINGTAVTIRWAGGLIPIPTNSGTDVFTFNLYFNGTSWIALATFTPFG